MENRISGALSALHIRASMGWQGAMWATFYSSRARYGTCNESIEHIQINRPRSALMANNSPENYPVFIAAGETRIGMILYCILYTVIVSNIERKRIAL